MLPARTALLLVALAAAPLVAREAVDPPFAPASGQSTAPFGNLVGPEIPTYSRVAPMVATAAAPGPAGLDRAKALGFVRVIDLRGAGEPGAAEDARHAAAIGLSLVALPMPLSADGLPAFTAALVRLVDDPATWPLLIVCGSANRSAAAWGLYRAARGVPALVALEEARAAGLTRAEPLLRAGLGLPQAAPSSAPATR